MRKERITLVDSQIIEETDEFVSYSVSVNTTGTTPDRVELKEEIYNRADVDVDSMHEDVPSEIGTVTYSDDNEIQSIILDDWVQKVYGN